MGPDPFDPAAGIGGEFPIHNPLFCFVYIQIRLYFFQWRGLGEGTLSILFAMQQCQVLLTARRPWLDEFPEEKAGRNLLIFCFIGL